MINLKVDINNVLNFIPGNEIHSYQDEISIHQKAIQEKTGKGNEFLGWVNLPSETDPGLIDSIIHHAKELQQKAELIIVVGIGGSYLGARAVIEALKHHFHEFLENRTHPAVLFAGHHMSEDYHADLIDILDKKEYVMVVISKSGTTTEPAIAFRLLKNHLEKKYGKKEAGKRIIAITDKAKGALKQLADEEQYTTFEVPDDIGGRYSVLTPVGLFPLAVAGIDIKKFISGAAEMQQYLSLSADIDKNPAALYAAARNALLKKNIGIEILVNYQPNLTYFTEWWKQLYGESEGKENKGIFPAGVNYTSDLHSMGQYIQEGKRNIFETVLSVKNQKRDLKIPFDTVNLDGLDYIAGKPFREVNMMARLGTLLAHVDGSVPNISIEIPVIDEQNLGQLMYFFEYACALSGYILGVNPFDQPGVEAYKKNMFALLGKPSFESETKRLRERLKL